MSLGPDDLPPAAGGLQQLHCTCTASRFLVLFSGDGSTMMVRCPDCGTTLATVPTEGGRVAMISADTVREIDPTRGLVPAPQPNGALLRGGPLDGKTVPVLPDVTTFMVGSGADAMASGSAWADTAGDAVRMAGGQATAYQDSGERTAGGVRIFDYAGGHHAE